MRYLIRRLVHAGALLIGASLLCFLFSDLAPGSFFDEMKLNPQISASTVSALRNQYGLDQSLPTRYVHWLQSVFNGEWGYSFAYNSPVRGLLLIRARNTLILTSLATVLAWMISMPMGIWIANKHGGAGDHFVLGSTTIFLALPELVLVLLFLSFSVRTHALPVGGVMSPLSQQMSRVAQLTDLAAHLVIPVCTLVLAGLPLLVRHVRASMIEALNAPSIQAARSFGIRRRRLLWRYALPSASNPLISLFGLSVAGLLSGSLLVEVATGWPGLGPLLLEATMSRDFYVVVGVALASTVFMIMGALLGDLMLVVFDPRVRMD